jgi:hypothetical protein
MMRARIGEYWDSDRAIYEDELDAWRERTAPVAAEPTILVRRPRRTTTRRPASAGPMSSSPTEPAARAA